jgi:type IV pilus assembly protein PilX
MKIKTKGMGYRGGARRENGMIATLLAIIVLVATLLASVALMRSIDTSNTIAGSLAFRQAVIQIADIAYQQALGLNFFEPTSDNNNAAIGYYATLQLPITTNTNGVPDILVKQLASPATPNNTVAQLTGLPVGYYGYYVVERLCPAVGPASPTACIVPGATISGGSVSNQTKDNGPPFSSSTYAAFRLTAGVVGPKNTIGYVQTVLR